MQHSRLPFEKTWRPPSAENAVSAVNRSGYLVQPSPAEDASHALPGKAIPQMTTKSPPSDSTFARFRIPCPYSIAYSNTECCAREQTGTYSDVSARNIRRFGS